MTGSRRDHIAWARAVVGECPLDPTAAHVLLVLATYANPSGWAWPGRETLMVDTGRKRVAINDALSRLRAAGVVEHLPAAPGRPARYRLATLPPDESAPDVADQPATSPQNAAGQPAASTAERGRNVAGPPATSAHNVAGTWPERGRNVAGQPAAEVEEEEVVAVSPSVVGRAQGAPPTRTNSIADQSEEEFAKRLHGMLERGIDGLTSDEPMKRPAVPSILAALRQHPVPREVAEHIAVEVRSICQSQNRAPNVAALFARRLADYERRLAEHAGSAAV